MKPRIGLKPRSKKLAKVDASVWARTPLARASIHRVVKRGVSDRAERLWKTDRLDEVHSEANEPGDECGAGGGCPICGGFPGPDSYYGAFASEESVGDFVERLEASLRVLPALSGTPKDSVFFEGLPEHYLDLAENLCGWVVRAYREGKIPEARRIMSLAGEWSKLVPETDRILGDGVLTEKAKWWSASVEWELLELGDSSLGATLREVLHGREEDGGREAPR